MDKLLCRLLEDRWLDCLEHNAYNFRDTYDDFVKQYEDSQLVMEWLEENYGHVKHMEKAYPTEFF